MKTKRKTILMVAIIAIGQILALPASAEHNSLTGNKGTDLLIGGAIGCAIGVAGASSNTLSKGANCAIVGGGTMVVGAILGDIIFHSVPDSRWSFDGGDGMPKAVYSFSNTAKLSFGAKGKSLDYNGIAVGVQYSF